MKQHATLVITLLTATSLFTADNKIGEAIKSYQNSKFSEAIPGLEQAVGEKQDTLINMSRLAQCKAAQALDNKDVEQLKNAIKLFIESDQVFQPGDSEGEEIVVSDQGFGDTIQWGYFLKELNKKLKELKIPEIRLHLAGIQKLLKPILERSGVATQITTGQLDRDKHMYIKPLIGILTENHAFSAKHPYLIPKKEAIATWQKNIDNKRLNIATAWRSGDKPVLGGRMLYRDLPLKTIIDLALEADPNAHIYLVQGPPHTFVTKSEFDKMGEGDKQKHEFNVIPDNYTQYVTQVKEENGAFEDTLAVLSQCIYVGSDTVIPHISGNVKNGQAVIMLPPKNEDDTSNRDWRWGEGNPKQSQTEGETTPWYDGNKVRIFELNPHEPKNLAPVVSLLKQWHAQRQAV